MQRLCNLIVQVLADCRRPEKDRKMKIAGTAEGTSLDAEVGAAFGRCPLFLFVNPETMEYTGVANSARDASGGAGIRAAQRWRPRMLVAARAQGGMHADL